MRHSASFDRAVALSPNHVEAHSNRGIVLRQLMRPAEALATFDKVIGLNPNSAAASYNRGNALRDLRRPTEAVAS